MHVISTSGRAASRAAEKGARAFLPSVPLRMQRAGVSPRRTDAEGRIEGYASIFGAMDLARDVVLPGAFRDSLARKGPRGVKLLWQHDPHQPVGIWDELTEDRHGLYVRGRLDLDLPKARDLHGLVERGALDGLSIGYRTEIDRRDPETNLRRLEKVDLWEVSLVTFPLLPQARIAELKGCRPGIVEARTSRISPRRIPALS